MAKLEIACFNLAAAKIAQANNADRVEFCAEQKLGGTTPRMDHIREAREFLEIPLYVMIRPRGGNFVYSDQELEQMKEEISLAKKLGVDGFVFGILHEDNTVNVEQNSLLVELASPLPCTFHRAFDAVPDMPKALESVISCGFSTILTSGGQPNVDLGLAQLADLVRLAEGRVSIMPGGGLRSTNINHLARTTRAPYFHSSAITDGSQTAVAAEVLALKNKLNLLQSARSKSD